MASSDPLMMKELLKADNPHEHAYFLSNYKYGAFTTTHDRPDLPSALELTNS